MPPFRYTVSLVNRKQADLCVADHFDKSLII